MASPPSRPRSAHASEVADLCQPKTLGLAGGASFTAGGKGGSSAARTTFQSDSTPAAICSRPPRPAYDVQEVEAMATNTHIRGAALMPDRSRELSLRSGYAFGER